MQIIAALGVPQSARSSPDARPPNNASRDSFAEYLRSIEADKRDVAPRDRSREHVANAAQTASSERSTVEGDRTDDAAKRRGRFPDDHTFTKTDKQLTRSSSQKDGRDETVTSKDKKAASVHRDDGETSEPSNGEGAVPLVALASGAETVDTSATALGRKEPKSQEADAANDATPTKDALRKSAGDAARVDDETRGPERAARSKGNAGDGKTVETLLSRGTVGAEKADPSASAGDKLAKNEAAALNTESTKIAEEDASGDAEAVSKRGGFSGISPTAVASEEAAKHATRTDDGTSRYQSKRSVGKLQKLREARRDGTTARSESVANAHGEKSADAVSGAEKNEARAVSEIEVHLGDESIETRGGSDGNARGDADMNAVLTRFEHAPTTPTQRHAGVSNAAGSLARRLNGDLGGTIVRQAKVMLKEAEQAEIRLIIRPPELGRVRINLQMEHGHIAGRILVDNGSVREVVEQNLAALQRAFEEAGLEVGDFEVSARDARDEAANDRSDDRGNGGNRATRGGAERFSESIEVIEVNDYSHRRINLVA